MAKRPRRFKHGSLTVQLSSCILLSKGCVYPSCTASTLCEDSSVTLATLVIGKKTGIAELRRLLDQIEALRPKLDVTLVAAEGKFNQLERQLKSRSGR